MSHLIIEQGKNVGSEVTVPASGIKYGRSPGNDLVLEHPSVMLFQGRFFFKSDGALWITDFSAAEKTTVGGEPIDEYALKVGDLVEVGDTALRVISVHADNAENAESAPVPEPSGKKDEEEIDLGFNPPRNPKEAKEKPERTKGQSLVHRVLQVLVILLILLVIAIAAPQLTNRSGGGVALPQQQEKSVSFTYERVRGNYKDIFRYALELTPEGKASIEIDNLGTRKNAKSADVPKEALEGLARRLASTGFFEIKQDYVAASPNTYNYSDVAIYCNGKFNHVRVLNREVPKDLEHAVGIIEEFIFKQLDVPFTLLEDDATLLRQAADSFKLGEARYSERDVRPGNLAEAVRHYKEAVVYLESLDLKPDLYQRVKAGMERAAEEQDRRYKDYKFNAERAMRLGDWLEAEKQLRILAELIPDRKDPRYDTISAKQMEVEEHLR